VKGCSLCQFHSRRLRSMSYLTLPWIQKLKHLHLKHAA